MSRIEYVPSVAMNRYTHRWSEIMYFMQMNMIANSERTTWLQSADESSLSRLNTIASLAPGIQEPEARLRVLTELVLGRLVDDFKGYLCEIVADGFSIRPDLLDEAKIKLEERKIILKFYDSADVDFASCYAHFKVDKLSSSINVKDFVAFCSELIGEEITPDASDITTATEALAVRNLLVHTKGKVNARFISRTGRTDVKIGKLINVSTTDCQRWDRAMWNLVKVVDHAIVTKIGIREFVDLHLREDGASGN